MSTLLALPGLCTEFQRGKCVMFSAKLHIYLTAMYCCNFAGKVTKKNTKKNKNVCIERLCLFIQCIQLLNSTQSDLELESELKLQRPFLNFCQTSRERHWNTCMKAHPLLYCQKSNANPSQRNLQSSSTKGGICKIWAES